jgi:hypothetical protein
VEVAHDVVSREFGTLGIRHVVPMELWFRNVRTGPCCIQYLRERSHDHEKDDRR